MIRGLRNLRRSSVKSSARKATRAGVSKEVRDHELFMQITCLEMEKVRRLVERKAACTRISEIDDRLAEVESERVHLLRQLAERGTLAEFDPSAAVRLGETIGPDGGDLLASTGPGFRIRY